MRENLLDSTFVVIDLETTGFNPERAEVIDIAAVRVEGGIITDRFSSLVYPGFFIPDRIKELTGITNAMLIGQPRIEEVFPQFLKFIGDSILVGHFIEQDIRFLDKYYRRLYGKRFKRPTLCTLKLSRKLFPELKKYSLESLSDFFGYETNGIHRALKDAELTAHIFLRILNELWNRYGIGDYFSIKKLEKSSL